jgi:hypothetical protein
MRYGGQFPRCYSARAQLRPRSAPLAFRLHHLPKAIFDRHEHERKPIEILHSQGRLGQGYHIYPSDWFIR